MTTPSNHASLEVVADASHNHSSNNNNNNNDPNETTATAAHAVPGLSSRVASKDVLPKELLPQSNTKTETVSLVDSDEYEDEYEEEGQDGGVVGGDGDGDDDGGDVHKNEQEQGEDIAATKHEEENKKGNVKVDIFKSNGDTTTSLTTITPSLSLPLPMATSVDVPPPLSPRHAKDTNIAIETNTVPAVATTAPTKIHNSSSSSNNSSVTHHSQASSPARPNQTTTSSTSTSTSMKTKISLLTDEDYDVARKAAVQLAAVAAAATANHKSPALAAREARLVAQSLMEQTDAEQTAADLIVREWKTVRYTELVAYLQQQPSLPPHGQPKEMTQPASFGKHHPTQLEQPPEEQGSVLSSSSTSTHSSSSSSSTTTTSSSLYPTTVWNVLCAGGNKTLLQHFCLLEHVRCIDDPETGTANTTTTITTTTTTESNTNIATTENSPDAAATITADSSSSPQPPPPPSSPSLSSPPSPPPLPTATMVSFPAPPATPEDLVEIGDRLLTLVKKVEGAYDSLLSLLPHVSQHNQQQTHSHHPYTLATGQWDSDPTQQPPPWAVEDDMDTPVVVPDLLPPCTTKHGDATLAFFRACVGQEEATLAAQARASRGPSSSMPDAKGGAAQASSSSSSSSSLNASSGSTTTTPAGGDALASPDAKNQQQQQSTLLTMFKKHSGLSVFRKSMRDRKDDGSTTLVSSASATVSSESSAAHDEHSGHSGSGGNYDDTDEDCYPVKIEREMLGLTVENVLERTVVRTVLASGPAKKAGAKVGSLIVKVGNIETKNLTHFETIDELRQSQRPLQLIMKQISDDALRAAREEMGRLIKGSGFGTIMDTFNNNQINRPSPELMESDGRPLIGADLRIDAYTNLIKRRFSEATSARNRKEEAMSRVGEKLVWMLTLFAVGLQREACRLHALAQSSSSDASTPRRHRHSLYSHTASDYEDAAKSVSKVLMDYARKHMDPLLKAAKAQAGAPPTGAEMHGPLRRRKGPPPPPPPLTGKGGRGGRGPGAATAVKEQGASERPLTLIGDVLQRTRTFLADTTSPPAALLRGELIAFLCDVLDIDTEMELAEEESASAVVGGSSAKAGMIMDLGSAGSLLKLIVLNCPIMRSPGCEDASQRQERLDLDIEEELRRRFGAREKFTSSDLHKLHAGNRFLSVVHRLAASRSTSARIAACSLGPVLWGHLDFPHQLQLRGVITRALHDPEVIVRKSTATVLHEIAELVFDRRSVPWLVLMCERAMTDPEPQLRSAAMTLTWHLAEHLPNAFLGDASKGSRYLRRLPSRDDPIFADVYLLQCKILPVATRLAEDRSPAVRLAVAAQCDRLCDALGDHWSSVIIDVLLALLSDSDDRVRCEAVSCVPRLAEIVLLSVQPGHVAVSEVSILEALVPASIKLQKDPSPSVRVALAAAAGDLLALLVTLQSRFDQTHARDFSDSERSDSEGMKKYKRQVDDRLIPLVQALLNDKDPEVTSAALRAVTNATRSSAQQSRHRHMSMASEDDSASLSSFHSQLSDKKVPVLTPVLSEKQVLRLLPTLTQLANSRQWRVRQSAVEIVPALLGCTQQLDTRTEISKLCVRLMSDKVDAVRKTSAECLCMGAGSLGSHGEGASAEWMTSIVIPAIRHCATHKEAKQRLLSLKMVETILLNGACPSKWKEDVEDADRLADTPMRELVSIALSLTGDRIANVRLNVGRILESVIHVFEDEELMFIREVLTQQIEEERTRDGGGDGDVLFFGQRCIYRARMILDDRSLQQEDTLVSTYDALDTRD